MLADVTAKTSMYEPTGGNGMLTINALPANVTVGAITLSAIKRLDTEFLCARAISQRLDFMTRLSNFDVFGKAGRGDWLTN